MKKRNHYFVFTITGMWLVPYLLTVVLNGIDTVYLKKQPDIEEVLPVIVSEQISDDYEREAVAAQAVIARSNLYRKIKAKKTVWNVLSELYGKTDDIWKFFNKDMFFYVEGQLKLVPYHEMSAGKTRDGAEVLHTPEFGYLKSVESNEDKNSPDYLNSTYISEQQMPDELEINKRDSSGYILSMKADTNILEGESFSQGLGLASSNFSIQKLGDQFRFLCKGKGHGLGYSQYGGNEMAKEGKTWEEILEKYFPEMEIAVYSEENKI